MTRVKIVSKTHPHTGEVGTIKVTEKGAVKIQTIGTKEMFEIILKDCPHGVSGCFVSKDDVQIIE